MLRSGFRRSAGRSPHDRPGRQPQRRQVGRLQRADRHLRRRLQLPRHDRRAHERRARRATTSSTRRASTASRPSTTRRPSRATSSSTADVVVNVVDAVHLERDLFLTLQLVDMGKRRWSSRSTWPTRPRKGVAVDRDLLEDLLGVPVIETVAVEGEGFDELRQRSPTRAPGHADPELRTPTRRDGRPRGHARRGADGARGRRGGQRAPRRRAGATSETRSTCAGATA